MTSTRQRYVARPGILGHPSGDTAEASEHVDVAVVTGLGIVRNAVNVLSSDVVVACGNAEAGTLSEVALAMKAGRPVVLLTEDDEARRFLGASHPQKPQLEDRRTRRTEATISAVCCV